MTSGWWILLAIAGFWVSIFLWVWLGGKLSELRNQAKKYAEAKPILDNIDSINRKQIQDQRNLEFKKDDWEKEKHRWEEWLKYEKSVIEYLPQEKTKGFPWLATAYDNYYKMRDGKLVDYLKSKPHSATKSAEVVRQITKERREAEKAARQANYLLDYCKSLAPWLEDYIGIEAQELDTVINEIHSTWEKKEEEFDEEVKRHFGPKFSNLTPTEKLQNKLDWWWNKPNKTDWQIGREYERYIGYLYESRNWEVDYHGKKGFEDLGRDLVCKNGKSVEILQCKRWSQAKEIHEKHIYYLFGTTVEYFLDHYGNIVSSQLSLFPELIKNNHVTPRLITTANVSPKAEQVAKLLGVGIDHIPFRPYPSVKCNVSHKTGEKIFHLPFDQQYDNILIEEERIERYVDNVQQAESLGFRHAFHWKGETEKP